MTHTATMRTCTALAILSCAAACNNPQADKPSDLPTLRQIESRLSAPTDPYPNELQPQPRALVYAMAVPLAPPPDEAWHMLTTDELNAASVQLWQANGLRIGIIEASRLGAFFDLIEPPLGIEQKLVYGSSHYSSLALSPRLQGVVDITLSAAQGQEQVRLGRGRAQFLVRISRDDKGQVSMEMVPHHHVKKFTLEVRSPMERALDGKIFDELKLATSMQTNRLIVIAPLLPAVPQEQTLQQPDDENEAEKADDEVDDEADPADPPVVPEPPEPLEPAKIPFHLGRLLLTASRVRQPYQVIAIIGLDPRPEQAPDPDKED